LSAYIPPSSPDRRSSDLKQLTLQPAPGKWSVAQITAHLADAEIVIAWRLRQIAATNGTAIQAYDQDVWATTFDYAHRDAKQSLRSEEHTSQLQSRGELVC